MKKLLFSTLILSILLSCNETDEETQYFYSFKLKESDGKAYRVNIIQEKSQFISGNGLKNIDSISVGFGFTASFKSPSQEEINQAVSFYLSFLIPEEEFYSDSGSYVFKVPSDLKNYIPSGNLFDTESLSFSTYFHEDIMTFCSASVDTSFDNDFKINHAKYYIDENGKDAMDIEGIFAVRYHSTCKKGDVELEDGIFRIKLMIDKIP